MDKVFLFEFELLLLLSFKCWDYKHWLSCPALCSCYFQFHFYAIKKTQNQKTPPTENNSSLSWCCMLLPKSPCFLYIIILRSFSFLFQSSAISYIRTTLKGEEEWKRERERRCECVCRWRGDRTQGLKHFKQTLYHSIITPAQPNQSLSPLFPSFPLFLSLFHICFSTRLCCAIPCWLWTHSNHHFLGFQNAITTGMCHHFWQDQTYMVLCSNIPYL